MADKALYDPPKTMLTKYGGGPHLKSFENYKRLHEQSIRHPETFWGREARELLDWSSDFKNVHSGSLAEGDNAWFLGGRLNACYNCVDRHAMQDPKRIAIQYEGDEPGTGHSLTYGGLLHDVCRLANVLRETMGIRKGDIVAIYMPMIPETLVACLACARIGAVHTVIFAGFSAEAIRDRVVDARCKAVLTIDQSKRGGKTIGIKALVDKALEDGSSQVQKVLVLQHTGHPLSHWAEGRDLWWYDEVKKWPGYLAPVSVDAEDPLFLLYTSGSTGKPKGVVHATGGFLVGAALTGKHVFDIHSGDRFFCACDIGWITGHAYLMYAPLLLGVTTIVFEGVPSYPTYSRYFDILTKYDATHMYLAPTALRAIKRAGDSFVQGNWPNLRVLGSVGEPIAPEVWKWYYEVVGHGECPVVDTYWQTETGSHVITPLAGVTPMKPGSASLPFFGIEPAILDPVSGKEITEPDTEGVLAFKQPWPSMARSIYGAHDRYMETYLHPFPGYYYTGDGAVRDKDGYYWIRGRMDDIINVSGHRISTSELEAALLEHPLVAEAAVVSSNDELTGQAANAFVLLKGDADATPDVHAALRMQIRSAIGPFATPKTIHVVKDLPKTRSGKIMRRVIRKVLAGEQDQLGDLSTLADPSVVDHVIEVVHGKP